MKRFKLFTILFIVVCLLSVCTSVSATGLEETNDVSFTVEASASTVSASGTLKVTVAIDKNDGFKYAKTELVYDASKLTLVGYSVDQSAFKTTSGTNAVSLQEVTGETGRYSIMIGTLADMMNIDPTSYYGQTGTVVVFEFKAAEGLADGTEIKIKLDVMPVNVLHPNKFNDFEAACNATGDSVTVKYQKNVQHTCNSNVTIPGKAATCSTTGLTDGKSCSICGAITVPQTVIPTTDHTAVTVKGTPATCTTDGRSDFIFCSVCEATIQEATVIKATGHNWTPATCTTAKTCENCGITEGTVAGHQIVEIPAVASTCTVAGTSAGEKCSVCGEVTKAPTALPLAAHKTVEIPAVASTCTVAGTSAGEKCSVCGEVTKAPTALELAAHKIVKIEGKAATCTNPGKTDGEKCSVCGYIKTAQTEIPKLGHNAVTVPGFGATCTEAGKTSGERCSVCNATLVAQTTIPAKGHNYGAWTNAGENHKKVCAVCGDAKTADHNWDEGVVVKEPAEEEDGEKKFTCKDCGATKTQILPGLNHEHKYEATTVAPNCTEDGSIVYTCACGDTYTEAGEAALGHTWVDATCTTAKYCSVCETVEGDIPGHTFGEWVFMEEPTATKDGSKTRECSVCHFSETETIPATGTEPTEPTEPSEPGTTAPNGTDKPATENNTILIVAIVALFVAAGAIIVLLVLKKK